MQFKLSEGNDKFSVDITVIDVMSGFASISYKVRNDWRYSQIAISAKASTRRDQSYFQSFKHVQNKLIFSVPVYCICVLPKKTYIAKCKSWL
jgi:uncharacterized protein (DUF2461 family)